VGTLSKGVGAVAVGHGGLLGLHHARRGTTRRPARSRRGAVGGARYHPTSPVAWAGLCRLRPAPAPARGGPDAISGVDRRALLPPRSPSTRRLARGFGARARGGSSATGLPPGSHRPRLAGGARDRLLVPVIAPPAGVPWLPRHAAALQPTAATCRMHRSSRLSERQDAACPPLRQQPPVRRTHALVVESVRYPNDLAASVHDAPEFPSVRRPSDPDRPQAGAIRDRRARGPHRADPTLLRGDP
jgi:hypothetical protein